MLNCHHTLHLRCIQVASRFADHDIVTQQLVLLEYTDMLMRYVL